MGAPALHIYGGNTADHVELPVRGVGWVLRWAAVAAVVSYSAIVLAAFSYRVSAEHALHRAAKIGLREAAQPRATSESVESVVRQHLATHDPALRTALLQINANGQPLRGPLRLSQGERRTLSLSASTADFVPRWLTLLTGESLVAISVDHRIGIR